MNNIRYRQMLMLFIVGLLLYGLFRSTPPLQLLAQHDKAVHFIGFAVTTAMILCSLSGRWYRYCGIGAIGLLAVLSEYVQDNWLPHRHFASGDMEANIAGILLVLLVILFSSRLKRNR